MVSQEVETMDVVDEKDIPPAFNPNGWRNTPADLDKYNEKGRPSIETARRDLLPEAFVRFAGGKYQSDSLSKLSAENLCYFLNGISLYELQQAALLDIPLATYKKIESSLPAFLKNAYHLNRRLFGIDD